jgi:hypothetical protein
MASRNGPHNALSIHLLLLADASTYPPVECFQTLCLNGPKLQAALVDLTSTSVVDHGLYILPCQDHE